MIKNSRTCISNFKNIFPGVIPPDPHDNGEGRGRERRGRKRGEGRGGEEREGWDGVNPPKTNPGYGPCL
jgi:hypothetical protein